MKKTKLTRSLLAACSIVALTAVMYGCVHDGDDPPATDGTPTAEEQVTALQGQINALRMQLGLEADDNLSDSITQLQNDLAALQKQAKDEQDEKDKMAAEAAAKDARALFAGIGETTSNLTVGVTEVADEDGGGMASVTATGLTPGVGMHDDLMKSAEPMLGMWQGTMLTRAVPDDATANPGTSSTVVVYTDIEAAKAVPFGDVYDLDTNGNLAGTGEANANVLHADNQSKISASDFMHTGRKDHDPDADSATDIAKVRGTFNGASGEYRCLAATATSCASHDAGDGAVRLEGAWVFDPDSGAMAMMADGSFAYFGWWLNKGTTEGVEAGVFHGVTDLTGDDAQLAVPGADDGFDALGGTATYKGPAAGKYAINPGLSAASGGHWTADATLTADFGAADAAGTISGMVDSFMAGGEMMDWSVSLGETVLTTETGAFDSSANSGSEVDGDDVVWTIGGVAGAESGSWQGDLYAPGDNNVPTVATGMFSGTHGTVGHIMGAFGAHVE